MRGVLAIVIGVSALLTGCARDVSVSGPRDGGQQQGVERSGESSVEPAVELAPGLRLDRAARTVEFDGTVAIDAHHPDTPVVYLELIACAPDTREHETLVVTAVRPSLIHAALLALGAEPGEPGRVTVTRAGAERTAPTGDRVRVEVIAQGRGAQSPWAWVREHDGSPDAADPAGVFGPFVFAGSRTRERAGRTVYDADGTGVIVGLTTFGSEVIAPTLALSPESAIDTPAWIADRATIPTRGTPVTVRLTAID